MRGLSRTGQILALVIACIFLWCVNLYFSDSGSKDRGRPTAERVEKGAPVKDAFYTVTRVSDGDTIYVRDKDGNSERIRFLGIDAPETKMPYGEESRKALKKILDAAGKKVEIVSSKRDQYNRIVGKVLADGKDVNLEMIKNGNAWYYKNYARDVDPEDRKLYAEAQREAKKQGLGLWADPNAQEPWEWRKQHPRD